LIRRPRTILALLTALNLLNYLDRYVLAAVLPGVQDDLRLSGAVAGSLATVFLIGYFATSPIFGILADRAGPGGRKRLMALGIAVWSAATIASGLARGTGALIVARALVGVGEASYATITPSLIDDIAPSDRKGRWLAIFFAAIPIGSALGYLVGGAVESATHSWRSSFFVAGIPGVALAALCLLIAEPPRTAKAPSRLLNATGELLRLPLYRSTVIGYCAYTFAIGGFSFWAPSYLHLRYGIETGHAAFVFGLVTVAGGAIGTLAGGFIGDRAARDCKDDEGIARAALRVCVLSAGLGAPLAAAAIAAPSAEGFYGTVLFCEIALFLLGGPFNVAVLRSVPPAQRASAMAISIFGSHLLGDLWSPPLIGFVKDHASIEYAILLAPLGFALAAIVWWRAPMRLTRAVAVR
jgi:MFS transporter, Spinster family, sphingosine-1-phosphate transporter